MIAGVLEPKRLEFLREVMPATKQIYMLINPNNPGALVDHKCDGSWRVRAGLRDTGARGGWRLFYDQPARIIELTARHQIPVIYYRHEAAFAGGLISYGTDLPDAWRQVGLYAGRILKGEKPADMPVSQVTKMQLVINLKTAKALGLSIPLSLLVRADEVIE
jgi:putative tryptophan/tyrosine transport system substrate-binding protein